MRRITEQQILSLATNLTAVANAKKISQKGGFVRRYASADETFYRGECKGSGKTPYNTSVDFSDPSGPVFRCSCPSRQFPCKHGLALLYELQAGKRFEPEQVPQEILDKRQKRQLRAEKAAAKAAERSEADAAGAATAPQPAPKAAAQSARAKKLKAQLEGLQMTETLVRDLLAAGLGSMGGAGLDDYRQLARQLGDYYLPGPQLLLHRLIREMEQFRQDGADSHCAAALELLRRLWALTRKGQNYLQTKLDSGSTGLDADPLYAELGGVWKLTELEAVGCCRRDLRMVQLAFWVGFDEDAQTWQDVGVWADVSGGPLYLAQNFRPVRALRHLRADDSVFDLLRLPMAALYPGEGNPRIRWEEASPQPVTGDDRQGVLAQALPVAAAAKQAKNLLKNTLAAPVWFALVRYARIGKTEQGYVLQDEAGQTLLLADAPGLPPTAAAVGLLGDGTLLEQQVLLAGFFYDAASRRLMAQPISILTADAVVRLLY